MICASVAVAVSAEQVLDILCIFPYPLLITVITVDEYYEMMGGWGDLGALVVAGRGAYSADGITIYGQSLYIEHAASDAFVWFAFASDA